MVAIIFPIEPIVLQQQVRSHGSGMFFVKINGFWKVLLFQIIAERVVVHKYQVNIAKDGGLLHIIQPLRLRILFLIIHIFLTD